MSAAESRQPTLALEWALTYARRGWSVVPVRPPQKIPAVSWLRYQTIAADERQIRGWFDTIPGCGVGILTGALSGVFVLDFDGEDGAASRRELERRGLPPAPTSLTGGGGAHMLFRHPGRRVPTRKSAESPWKLTLPGMDVRGDGGFIVAPPSLHGIHDKTRDTYRPSGNRYAWDVDAHPDDLAIPECPEWLLSIICAETEPGDPGHHAEIVRLPSSLGLDGAVSDGREAYMRDTVLAVVSDLYRKLGTLPSPEQVTEAGWDQYARNVDFSRPGRGRAEWDAKVRYTLARATRGAIRGFEGAQASATAEPEQPEQASEPPRARATIRLMSIDEVEAMQPPEWLVDGLLPEQCLAVPYGPPKVGKTFIILSMALHIAGGLPWMGKAVRQGPVVYVAGEGVGGLSVRIKGMRKFYGIDQDAPFWVVPRAVNFRDPKAVAELRDAIREATHGRDVALVVLDTLARAMPGVDENSAEEVGLVIAAADQLKHDLKCTVMPVAHTGKDLERGLRGSSAIHGALDASFLVKGTEDGRVIMTNEDQKDAEAAPAMTFRMETVAADLGRTTLVPVLDDAPPPSRDRKPLSPGARAGLTALQEALAKEGTAVTLRDIPAGVPVVPLESWRREFHARSTLENYQARKKAFQRASKDLLDAGTAMVLHDRAWLIHGDKEKGT